MEPLVPVHIESLRARLASGEDSTERLRQLNWCEFILPTAKESFVTEKGGLFFKATVADLSGHINVQVREQAALGLTGLPSKEAFLQEAEDLTVPLVASCRLLMREQGLLVVEASPRRRPQRRSLSRSIWSMRALYCAKRAGQSGPCRALQTQRASAVL